MPRPSRDWVTLGSGLAAPDAPLPATLRLMTERSFDPTSIPPRGDPSLQHGPGRSIDGFETQLSSYSERWQLAVAIVIAAMVAYATAAYGGVEPQGELLLLVAAGPLAGYALFGALRGGLGSLAKLMLGLVVAYAGLAVLQVIPMPIGWVAWLSPTRAEVVTNLLDPPPASTTISYSPVETIASLRLLFIAISVFAAAALLCRSLGALRTLLYGLALVGTAEAGLALAQVVTDAEGIYWDEPMAFAAWTGSFVNHSNFAQFINLTLGATLASFLVRLREDLEPRRGDAVPRVRGLEGFLQRYGVWLVAILIQAVAVAISLSRAGLLGMVLAATLACFVLRRTSRLGSSVWTLAIVPPVAFVLLLLVGLDAVYLRIDTLQESTSYADRFQLGLCTLRAGLDHAVFGTGLGTHGAVFPAYDTTGSIAVAEQADNDYAQLFEEQGLVGVFLVAGMIGTLVAAVRAVISQGLGQSKYVAYGALYGFVAIAVQCFTDFGQRVPAVFCVTAALAGVLVGLAANVAGSRDLHRPIPWAAWFGWGIGLAFTWVYLLSTGVTDYRAGAWRGIAESATRMLESADSEEVAQLHLERIAAAERAALLQPDRVELAFWLNAYRWEAVQLAASSPETAGTVDLNAVARRIADELTKTRQIGPTFGPAYTLEGQLRLASGDASGGALLDEGVRLSPNDPIACFAAAAHHLQETSETTNDEQAYRLMRRAVTLDRSLFDEAVGVLIDSRGAIEEATALAGDEPARLRSLADRVEATDNLADRAEQLREQALAIQRRRVELPDARVNELVDLASRLVKLGETDEAAKLLKRASALDFANRGLRFRLIDLLTKLGRYDEALSETKIAVRMQPNSAAVKQRLNRLLDLIQDEEATAPEDARNESP